MKYLKDMLSGMGIALQVIFALLIIGLIICGPFFTIWAINTLFAFGIGYSFKTWLAMLLIQGLFVTTIPSSKEK